MLIVPLRRSTFQRSADQALGLSCVSWPTAYRLIRPSVAPALCCSSTQSLSAGPLHVDCATEALGRRGPGVPRRVRRLVQTALGRSGRRLRQLWSSSCYLYPSGARPLRCSASPALSLSDPSAAPALCCSSTRSLRCFSATLTLGRSAAPALDCLSAEPLHVDCATEALDVPALG